MKSLRLRWQLFPSYLVIALVPLIALAIYSAGAIRSFLEKDIQGQLETYAYLISDRIISAGFDIDESGMQRLCETTGRRAGVRVTAVLPTGRVIGDSDSDPSVMDNHASRPEIRAALETDGPGISIRASDTLRKEMMYVAVPVKKGDKTVYVLRTSLPLVAIDEMIGMIRTRIAIAALIATVVAAIVSLWVSRRISRPLEQLTRGAVRFASGDLDHTLPAQSSHELSALADTLNRMAAELDERIHALVLQSNEQEAVLSSMFEGVLAVDSDERVISVNKAAAKMIKSVAKTCKGRRLQEIARNPDLQELLEQALSEDGLVERDIAVRDNGDTRYLRVHGTTLRAADGERAGAVIVINDVTRLRRLEKVRRDFIANVSHELKTPITSIKGFVETLLDGAMNKPDDAKRFLNTVARQADRLNAIVNDLLVLSRIEKETDLDEISLERGPIRGVMLAAIEDCEVQATRRNVSVDLKCDYDIEAFRHSQLLEQAVANLIDNAIKYSEPGSTVRVEVAPENGDISIRVADEGCGIATRHLARLFERFYRVDASRSRDCGGTGLGLAIVKHIAQAHGGRATVESVAGTGSVFTIRIPSV